MHASKAREIPQVPHFPQPGCQGSARRLTCGCEARGFGGFWESQLLRTANRSYCGIRISWDKLELFRTCHSCATSLKPAKSQVAQSPSQDLLKARKIPQVPQVRRGYMRNGSCGWVGGSACGTLRLSWIWAFGGFALPEQVRKISAQRF